MNGPEHYKEAERLLAAVAAAHVNPASLKVPESRLVVAVAQLTAEAQVHATLSLTAAMQPDGRAWADVTRYDKATGE